MRTTMIALAMLFGLAGAATLLPSSADLDKIKLPKAAGPRGAMDEKYDR